MRCPVTISVTTGSSQTRAAALCQKDGVPGGQEVTEPMLKLS